MLRVENPRFDPTQSHISWLNRHCHCMPLGRSKIVEFFHNQHTGLDLEGALQDRPNLFAGTVIFLSAEELSDMRAQISAFESLTRKSAYREHIASRSPDAFASKSSIAPGLFMGYDFHLTDAGPKLIEVNTNAGGAAIISTLMKAAQTHVDPCNLSFDIAAAASIDFAELFQREWKAAGNKAPLSAIAILDENPKEQYLYPDMQIIADALRDGGIDPVVAAPEDLEYKDDGLYYGALKIDLIYNRLTDFGLNAPAHAHLKNAWISGHSLFSPSPEHHALFADKRNLTYMSGSDRLSAWGLTGDQIAALSTIPSTEVVTPQNAEDLWARRKSLFFKPTDGFGSKAVYRGDKVTKKVWQNILGSNYVAQERVNPPTRALNLSGEDMSHKFDVRMYTYNGEIIAAAARIYQGQTTNFRTPGGGFAPVLTG